MEKHWSHRKIYEIYKNSIYGASKADIWRYCVLFTYGGVYLDFDSSINFRLEEIPKDCSEIISFEDNLIETQISKEYTPDYDFLSNLPKDSSIKFPDHIVLQWLLIFKKEHPILERVISEIEKNYDFYVNKTFETIHLASVNFYGPVLLTKVIWDYVLDGNTINQKNIDYDGLAKFKDISSDGVYSNDKGYYKNFYNSKLLFSDQVRLNLGCGEDLKKGFINIDVNKKADSVTNIEINDLKNHYKDGSVNEIFAKDVLEHVGLPTATKWIKQWSEILTDNGVITISTPCLDLIIEAYKKNKINEEKLNYLLFAGVYWKDQKPHWDTEVTSIYDWHKVCFSKKQIRELLIQNNFEIITERFDSIEGYINGLNMVIKAKKIDK